MSPATAAAPRPATVLECGKSLAVASCLGPPARRRRCAIRHSRAVLRDRLMETNPYQSPAEVNAEGGVDRAARTRLADAIRRYLDEQTSAFQFDEVVQEYQDSPDTAVRLVAQAVWCHYDDCVDHRAGLSKPEWDYFQRLLLLLDSESQVEVQRVRRWSWTQLLALACLAGLGWCVWQFGWGFHLVAYLVPCGLVSMALAFLRGRRKPGPYDRVLTPFASFAELNAAYRTAAGFVKKRFPRTMQVRQVHSKVAMLGVWLNGLALWTLVSPIILLAQVLPQKESTTRVRSV